MEKLANATEENIKVIVRLKPNSDGSDKEFLTSDKESNSINVHGRAEFEFDKVSDGSTSQEDIFQSCKGLFQSFVDGYNATIFAYGQTGSGKTYTMTGDCDQNGDTQNPGLIPRGLSYIFETINERAQTNNMEYLIKCSFVEIYNEQIFDLLDPQQQRLNLRVNITNEVYLEQCTETIMSNPKVADEILKCGLLHRHMASTEMNRESSRSHAVFTIILESREAQGDIAKIKKSCLHLVDLAGSERQKVAKTEGIRLKEAGMINKSLLALSMVIRKLVEAGKSNKAPYIMYRDSKLTLLLKDAIGGNSKTTLVACIHNDMRFMSETWSTLQFASSVKMIKNKAKINVDIHGDNESLRKEIGLLREEIDNFKMPQTIQDHEFDFDLLWKKRFIQAMALRSNSERSYVTLNEQITRMNLISLRQEKFIDSLKVELEIKNAKMKSIDWKKKDGTNNNNESVVETRKLIETTLLKLADIENEAEERIKCEELQIQVSYLRNEIEKANQLNLLSVSDQTLTHSLLKDYNNIVDSGDFDELLFKSDASNVAITNLQNDLSNTQLKYSRLKKRLNAINMAHRDERRKLEAEISSMRCNLKVADEQRVAAVDDRRKTLLSAQDLCQKQFSPVRNTMGINCRRRTKKPAAVVTVKEEDEYNSADEFIPLTDFLKKNDENFSQLDKICELEKELRENKTEMGTKEYLLQESQKEIEGLKAERLAQNIIKDAFKEMEAKYNSVATSLEESNEMITKLQRGIASLEVSKDKSIKLLSDKVFIMAEEIRMFESEKDFGKDELEQATLSIVCLKDEIERLENLVKTLQTENRHEKSLNESLNSKINVNISVFEELSVAKMAILDAQQNLDLLTNSVEQYRTNNINLQTKIEEYNERESSSNRALSLTNKDNDNLRLENDKLVEENSKLENHLLDLKQEMDELAAEHRNKICELNEKQKEEEGKFKCLVEEIEDKNLRQSYDMEALKIQIDEYETEIKLLKEKREQHTPSRPSRLSFQSPKMSSSPLMKSFIKDTESRSSLIDDLIVSKNETQQQLKEERDRIDAINTIVMNIFDNLGLEMRDSLVTSMETMEARIVANSHEFRDVSVRNYNLCTELEKKDLEIANQRNEVKLAKQKRVEFQKQLEEFSSSLTGTHSMNMKQRILYFQKCKDDNMRLRHDNMNLIDEKNELRMFLIHKHLQVFRDFEAYEKMQRQARGQ